MTFFQFHQIGKRQKQGGVALITAVLIVALATILAVNVGFRGFLDQRRTVTTFALDQSFQVALGGEAWAADSLRRDVQENSSKVDDFTEEWATPIPTIPIDAGDGVPIGEFEGVLEDMQGRFNLNSLVVTQGDKFVVNQSAVDRLKELLRTLELEDKWADLIADWIDSDGNEGFPQGAEDFTYTSLTPPYRTANRLITRTSELLALPEFGIERYQRLEPFVAALPLDTKINTCTASYELLDVLTREVQFTQARESNDQLRAQRCYPDEKDFKGSIANLEQKERDLIAALVVQQSSYFRATIWVTMGSTQFTMYSLLQRTAPTGLVRPILRSYGTL